MILQLNEQEQSIASLVRVYEISEQTNYRWKKIYIPDKVTGKSQAVLRQMEKVAHRLKQGKAIQKKHHPIHERVVDGTFIYY
ncbi:MAG: hypothetical protein L0L22_16985 [Staphylococcus equorum]|nr:hypothetical protein [Staphylococcus equorum]